MFCLCFNESENKETEGIGSKALVEPMPAVENYVLFDHMKHLELHEVCVTFKPKYHTLNSTQLHCKFRDWVLDYMEKYIYFQPSFIFVPEFNSAGVLHYHGIMYFNNANDYWIADFKRKSGVKWGRTQGKVIYNYDNYKKYIEKDIAKQKFTIKPIYFLSKSELIK